MQQGGSERVSGLQCGLQLCSAEACSATQGASCSPPSANLRPYHSYTAASSFIYAPRTWYSCKCGLCNQQRSQEKHRNASTHDDCEFHGNTFAKSSRGRFASLSSRLAVW